MQTRQLIARDGEKAKRIIVAQVGLYREWEFGKVRQDAKIRRMNAARVEGLAIVRDLFVDVP